MKAATRILSLTILTTVIGLHPSASAVSLDYDDNVEFEVSRKLSQFDSATLHNAKSAKVVRVIGAAEPTIFNDPKFFPRLESVVLIGDISPLAALAQNYPSIRDLEIVETRAIQAADLQNLARFRRLQTLDLQCPPQQGRKNIKRLAHSIQRLVLTNEIPQGSFPNLLYLSLFESEIDMNSFRDLNAPKLQTLCLRACEVKSAIQLRKFSHLQSLILDQTSIDKRQLDYLRSKNHIKILDANAPFGPPTKLIAPLRDNIKD